MTHVQPQRHPTHHRGWGFFLLVAVLMVVATPDKLVEALVFAGVALANVAWLRARRSRAAALTSLTLGALLTLMHAGYVFAGATADSFRATDLLFIADAAGVTGGALVVVAATKALVQRRNQATRSGVAA